LFIYLSRLEISDRNALLIFATQVIMHCASLMTPPRHPVIARNLSSSWIAAQTLYQPPPSGATSSVARAAGIFCLRALALESWQFCLDTVVGNLHAAFASAALRASQT